MTDVFSKKKRSEVMSKVKSFKTAPEVKIENLLKEYGLSYETHPKDVFGRPDIVNRENKTAVFIDGCFWHGHKSCKRLKNLKPSTNVEFWRNKVSYNRKRRLKVIKQLKREGWTVLEFWECKIREDAEAIAKRITKKLQCRQ